MIRYAEAEDQYPSGLDLPAAGAGTATDGLTVLVLESDQAIGGVAAFGPAPGEPGRETAELSVLSLSPDGWATGDGRRLHDAALEELRWAGFGEAVAWVLEADVTARRFYEEAGWEADGGERAAIERGLVLRRVRYRRPVPSSPVALRFDTATPDDMDDVLRLYDHVAAWMVGHGIQQWQPGDLGVGRLRHYIVDGEVTVLWSGDEMVGSVAITWEDPIGWGERLGSAGYVHLLMVARPYAGQGLGRRLLQRAERRISDSGLGRVRLDCVTSNLVLRRYYERAGYQCVGETDYGGRTHLRPGALYEKRLTAPPPARA